MIYRKTAVICRMPVLRGNDKWEENLDLVRDWNNGVAIRHRQCPTGKEVVLDIYKNKRFHKITEFGKLINCGGT